MRTLQPKKAEEPGFVSANLKGVSNILRKGVSERLDICPHESKQVKRRQSLARQRKTPSPKSELPTPSVYTSAADEDEKEERRKAR